MAEYTYEEDKPTLIKLRKEEADANRVVNQQYIKEVRELLKCFPCFSDRDLLIYTNKLWSTIKEENSRHAEDQLLDVLERAIQKRTTRNFLSNGDTKAFSAYRYILKMVRVVLDEKDEDVINEEDDLI